MANETLNAGQNSYTGIISWIHSTATNGGAGQSKHADTADVATKLGNNTIGGAAKPIYLNGGTPTAFSGNIGATDKPVFVSSGTLTVCSSTVGGTAKPVYMDQGQIKACSSTVGGTAKPVYMNVGTVTALTVTAGKNGVGAYVDNGTITASTQVGAADTISYIKVGTPSSAQDGMIWIES